MPEIRLRNLSKSYVADEYAVEELDLTIPDGSFVCLLGPSGCGKTTTLRMIAGLEKPNEGEIWVGDRNLDRAPGGVYIAPEDRNLGFMFQSYALWPHMTVEGNIGFGLQIKGTPRAEAVEQVSRMLGLLEVEGLGHRYASELSGGQQQRVALARMLAMNPDVWLMDEPLSNLDAALRLTMRSELKRLHQELGSTVVFVTHDQSEAMSMATHIAVMDGGRIQQIGNPMDIYKRPTNQFVGRFIGSPPMNMLSTSVLVQQPRTERLANLVGATNSGGVEVIGVRPEDVEFSWAGDGTTSDRYIELGEVTVETILPTGYEYIIGLVLRDTRMFALSREISDLEPGSTVDVRVHVDNLHLFDPSGDRMTDVSLAH